MKEPPDKRDCFDAIVIHQKETDSRGTEKKSLASLFFFLGKSFPRFIEYIIKLFFPCQKSPGYFLILQALISAAFQLREWGEERERRRWRGRVRGGKGSGLRKRRGGMRKTA